MAQIEFQQELSGYCRMGWRVFPIRYKEKVPLTGHGFKDAVNNEKDFFSLCKGQRKVNIGLPTGDVNGVFVIDFDYSHGGGEAEEKMTARSILPPTLKVKTANGYHYYYKMPFDCDIRNSAGKIAPGVDVRGNGGYVVLPPSVHPTAFIYAWANSLPIAYPSEELITLAKGGTLVPPADFHDLQSGGQGQERPQAGCTSTGQTYAEGQRNERLFALACSLSRQVKGEVFADMLRLFNQTRCTPPLPDIEVESMIARVGKQIDDGQCDAPYMSDVAECEVGWFWPGRFPLGKVSMLVGDPGLGKSFLTVDMAARITRGTAWPDGQPNQLGSVIMLSAEDDVADTIKPRLLAAGGDPSKVRFVRAVKQGGGEKGFDLQADLDKLGDVLNTTSNPRLVVIDPISAYMGDVDSHNNAEVRFLLGRIADLAARHKCGFLLVSHMNKGGGKKSVYRTVGSLAFTAAARAVWLLVAAHGSENRRYLLKSKMNIACPNGGLAFSIVDGKLQWEEGAIAMDADQGLAMDSELTEDVTGSQDAVTILTQILAGKGWIPMKEVYAQAEEAGISSSSIRKVRQVMGVEIRRIAESSSWEMRLNE